jgi:hypothetical protein
MTIVLAKLEHLDEQCIRLFRRGCFVLVEAPETTEMTFMRGRRIARSIARSSRRVILAEGWTPYLYEFHGPSFDIPFSLWDATDIIVNEKTLSSNSEDETISYRANTRDQLRSGRFDESVVEGIDSLDDNLVGIFGSVWTTVGRRRG